MRLEILERRTLFEGLRRASDRLRLERRASRRTDNRIVAMFSVVDYCSDVSTTKRYMLLQVFSDNFLVVFLPSKGGEDTVAVR